MAEPSDQKNTPAGTGPLPEYIAAAKERGLSDDVLIALLRQNGWSERSVYAAFSSYYERELGMPIPMRGRRSENAADAFLYLLAFISLGFWTVAAGHLFFVLIDRRFPSTLDSPYLTAVGLRQSLSFELATVLIAFPIFMGVSTLIARALRERPESRESGVRKWLTYAALVVTAVILLSDAIWFVSAFIHGDVTVRFVLKSLVTLSIAGGIFGYYLLAVRQESSPAPRDRIFAALAIVSALLALAFGFADIGTPAHARAVSSDERRVEDLKRLASDVYFRTEARHGSLPKTLDQIPSAPLYGGRGTRSDPATGKRYEYVPLGKRDYRLCASFDTEDKTKDLHEFAHGSGRQCFRLSADKPY
ncbi:MAG: hypothetical protein GIW95_11325 [Candidatus Eremiobacteraeota bacterium]|nr:hypothetical protein [Candidatus Eremiobacteraeota bacterium]